MRNKVSRAIAIPKASWGCAPALPNQIRVVFLEVRFPITSRRQIKSFSVQQFFKNAAEVWASSPHLRSKFNFVVWFSCCNCLRLEICSLSHKNSVCSAVHSCVRQICTCSADMPANDVNAVTIKFGLTLSGCPTDSIHSSTNAPAITCSA